VFCESVQLCLQFCLDHLSCVFNRRKRKKWEGGGWQSYFFSKKFSGRKGNDRRCFVVLQQPVLL
jgi:hypothetical protein